MMMVMVIMTTTIVVMVRVTIPVTDIMTHEVLTASHPTTRPATSTSDREADASTAGRSAIFSSYRDEMPVRYTNWGTVPL